MPFQKTSLKMKQQIAILLILLSIGCGKKQDLKKDQTDIDSTNSGFQHAENVDSNFEIIETFKDSNNIGVKGKYKIRLDKILKSDSLSVIINLYEMQNKEWVLKQKLKYEKDALTSCNPKLSDFNNDGLNDFTFISGVAARGANEIRKLYLFDKASGTLKLIRNSENYPNLQYNKLLDCLDSWMVYGGTSTIFLKVDGDSLRTFAGVSLFNDERETYLVDKNGEHKTLKSETIKDLEIYTRFKNYSPLIVNENQN